MNDSKCQRKYDKSKHCTESIVNHSEQKTSKNNFFANCYYQEHREIQDMPYPIGKSGSKLYQTANATQVSKNSHKVTGNTTATGADTKTKVALSTYTVVPYMSPHIGITSDELVEETTEYFRNYNLNGITGNLTILAISDFHLPYKLNSSTIATPQRMVSTSLKR